MPMRRSTVWDRAAREAHLTLQLPDRVRLFFRRIPKTDSRGFRMGDRHGEYGEQPVHRVVIPRDYLLGTFAITQEQYAAVARQVPELAERALPSHFQGARRPVEQVDWFEANRFCDWVNVHCLSSALRAQGWGRFCLPTEAEWERACRGGGETEYWAGDGEEALAGVAWYDANSGGETHPVDQRPEAHPYGLFGMHGNIWEWCHDALDQARPRERLDGEPDPGDPRRERDWASGLKGVLDANSDRYRVLRGGSWSNWAWGCRSAFRFGRRPDVRNRFFGFRVCLVPGPEASGEGGARESAGAAAEGRTGDGAPSHEAAESQGGPGARADADAWRHARLPPR